ncbi:MAG: ATP synthase F1 subunit epsilon [Acidaminococcaceae bacterium]|nr:ATP synthase F1 subunit epsilon [Acidaminococcaceae bacterium]MDD4721697.1 ATP synthase F1 subunit epsilon [Acidaminococcaceae bacterium]
MTKLMQLEVITPDKSLLVRKDISYVLAETVVGGVGILANHAPLIATLAEGPLKYQDEKGTLHFVYVEGGFMEVGSNKVTILSVDAQDSADIDVEKNKRRLEAAKNLLTNLEPTTDIVAVAKRLKCAKARLKTAELASANH